MSEHHAFRVSGAPAAEDDRGQVVSLNRPHGPTKALQTSDGEKKRRYCALDSGSSADPILRFLALLDSVPLQDAPAFAEFSPSSQRVEIGVSPARPVEIAHERGAA